MRCATINDWIKSTNCYKSVAMTFYSLFFNLLFRCHRINTKWILIWIIDVENTFQLDARTQHSISCCEFHNKKCYFVWQFSVRIKIENMHQCLHLTSFTILSKLFICWHIKQWTLFIIINCFIVKQLFLMMYVCVRQKRESNHQPIFLNKKLSFFLSQLIIRMQNVFELK